MHSWCGILAGAPGALNREVIWWKYLNLFGFYACVARDLGPFFAAIAYLRGEFLGAVADDIGAQIEKALLHVGLFQGSHDLCVQPGDNLARRVM